MRAFIVALMALAVSAKVLELTSATFDETLASNPVVMVEFFAPWCGHCKNLAPKYETASEKLNGIGTMASVDCTVESSLCQRFEVRGYPTVKLFRNGAPSDYNGPREVDALVATIKKAVLPAVSTVAAADLAGFVAEERVVSVFFGSADSADYKAFAEVAEQLREKIVFAICDSKDAATSNGAEYPGVMVFRQFDDGNKAYTGAFMAAPLTSFLTLVSTPLMDDIGPENYSQFAESGLPLAYLFVSSADQRTTIGKGVEAVAKDFKGKMNFVYIDANMYGAHGNNLNLKSTWPAFAIQEPQKNTKYPFDQTKEITEAGIRAFCTEFVEGKLKPSLKSEPVPEQTEDVFVIVGENYNEVANDKSRDKLIEFYAPWCGHCKKLAPIWDELAAKLKGNDKIRIAKMDANANDLPLEAPFKVQGFPTIKLITADNRVVDFNGDRTVEGFVDFLKQNAVHGKSIDAAAAEADHDEL